tara:strand:+ start:318 stop:1337 length:1020 start_codon:yes stop_codon:yes gene_type:complete
MKDIFKGKHGPLLIAEIGGNHEGDFNYAKRLVKLALETDVDVVKLQIYYPDTLVNKFVDPDRYSHFKKFTLSRDQHLELAEMCSLSGKKYLASVWDIDSFSWIDKYSDFYKIGSGDLTALPIIDEIVKKNKPIILSTGLSTFEEIEEIIKYIISKNKLYNDPNMLAVLQCTSMYPIPENEVNLNVIDLFKEKFNISIGYSDHTEDIEALFLAVAKGADILEFHFTDNKKNKTFRDHKVSLNSNDVVDLINRIKRLNNILGSKMKKPTFSEIQNKHLNSFRRGVFFNKNMKSGTIVKADDLVCLRPNKGIDARQIKKIINKKLNTDVLKLHQLNLKMFDE